MSEAPAVAYKIYDELRRAVDRGELSLTQALMVTSMVSGTIAAHIPDGAAREDALRVAERITRDSSLRALLLDIDPAGNG